MQQVVSAVKSGAEVNAHANDAAKYFPECTRYQAQHLWRGSSCRHFATFWAELLRNDTCAKDTSENDIDRSTTPTLRKTSGRTNNSVNYTCTKSTYGWQASCTLDIYCINSAKSSQAAWALGMTGIFLDASKEKAKAGKQFMHRHSSNPDPRTPKVYALQAYGCPHYQCPKSGKPTQETKPTSLALRWLRDLQQDEKLKRSAFRWVICLCMSKAQEIWDGVTGANEYGIEKW